MKTRGRPAYKPTKRHKERCQEAAREGLNDEQISRRLKISYRTFRKYKRQFEPYLKRGRVEFFDCAVPQVENALLKRCLGFEFEETKLEKRGIATSKDGKIVGESVVMVKTKKTIVPDPASMFFFLCNKSKSWMNPQSFRSDERNNESDDTPIFSNLPDMAAPEKNEPTNSNQA